MTNPYARPDQPDPQQPWTAPQDETIPLVPESGYTSRPSPWSEGYEHTAVDPFAAAPPGYTNPSFDAPAGPQPQRQPQPGYSLPPTAPTYEQPPMAAGYRPYEPLRDPAPAPMVPAYPQHYPMAASLPDHPNAVPTLVLAGDDDQVVPYKTGALMQDKLLRNSELIIYPGFSHGMLTVNADVVNADILKFIRG